MEILAHYLQMIDLAKNFLAFRQLFGIKKTNATTRKNSIPNDHANLFPYDMNKNETI